ncbi:hypothetical protein CCP3SC1AL1_620010 [Gammaproteobacteria bacterium]
MEEIKLFSIPIYKFKYSDHIEFKESVTPFLENEDTWKRVNSLATHIDFTNSNLHKMDAFSPIKNFIQTNIELVMEDLGFQPNIQITGMWGTRHRNAQYHHRHNHGNSFLAGIYYLNGNNNSGTTFFSPHNSHSQIIPAVKTVHKMQNSWVNPFQEGTLIIFPSWLEHSTQPNTSKSIRHILSFNTMPLGPTNTDIFDRYNFQDISNVKMVESIFDDFKDTRSI